MQALNLSVAALHRVDSNARDTDAPMLKMQAEIRRLMRGNQDELRSQLAELTLSRAERKG